MPSYVSKEGVWHPKKEKIGLINITNKVKKIQGQEVQPGDPFIYDGADRAALFELWKEKVETFGQNFRQDPEFIMRVRQFGYKDVDEYLAAVGYDKVKAEEEFKKNAAVVNKHELPQRIEEIKTLGGGKDFAGQGNDVYGGFGNIDVSTGTVKPDK